MQVKYKRWPVLHPSVFAEAGCSCLILNCLHNGLGLSLEHPPKIPHLLCGAAQQAQALVLFSQRRGPALVYLWPLAPQFPKTGTVESLVPSAN